MTPGWGGVKQMIGPKFTDAIGSYDASVRRHPEEWTNPPGRLCFGFLKLLTVRDMAVVVVDENRG